MYAFYFAIPPEFAELTELTEGAEAFLIWLQVHDVSGGITWGRKEFAPSPSFRIKQLRALTKAKINNKNEDGEKR